MSSTGRYRHNQDEDKSDLWTLYGIIAILFLLGLFAWGLYQENNQGSLVSSYTTRTEYVRKIFMYQEGEYGYLAESDGLLETKKLDCRGVKVAFKEDVPPGRDLWIERNYRSYSNPRFKDVLVRVVFHIHDIKSDLSGPASKNGLRKGQVLVFE